MVESAKKKYTVSFLPHERKIEVAAGESLIRAALQAGVHVNASCGGGGVCGKCRILVEDGQVAEGFSERLTDEDAAKGYRLACLARIESDVTIRIPVESSIDASALNKQVSPRRTATITELDFDTLKEQGLFLPPVIKQYLEISPPDAQNNMPDVSRLIEGLRQNSDWHKLELTLPVIRKLPAVLRADNFRVTATLVKPVRDDGKTLITNIQAGDTSDKSYAIALDIGTTTVYCQLIDLATGECLGEQGDFNGQISYGEDVISRIMYAEKPNREVLKRCSALSWRLSTGLSIRQ